MVLLLWSCEKIPQGNLSQTQAGRTEADHLVVSRILCRMQEGEETPQPRVEGLGRREQSWRGSGWATLRKWLGPGASFPWSREMKIFRASV